MRAGHRLLRLPQLQEDSFLPRQIRRLQKPQRAELDELQPARRFLFQESGMGRNRTRTQGNGAAAERQIPAMGLDTTGGTGKPPPCAFQRRQMPLYVDFNEQRYDKGRGRTTEERQKFRTQDIRRTSRRGNALLGRSRQNHLDQVRRWIKRKKRKFCAGKSRKMKMLYFCISFF